MREIKPREVLFINLGKKSGWKSKCIEKGQIRLGFREANHRDCCNHHWNKVTKDLRKTKTKGKATEITNQIQRFYESKEDVLWITFHGHRMWWAFAKRGVKRLPDGSKIRRVIGRWRDKDIHGNRLSLDKLSGKLTKTQGFRGTICQIHEANYATDKINGECSLEVMEARRAKDSLEKKLVRLIQNLGPKDFELFAQLIFTSAGWQRLGVLGGPQKGLDLDLQNPVTGERMMVQVKSSSNLNEFEESCNYFRQSKDFRALYYVVHTPDKRLKNAKPYKHIHLILDEQLAELAIDAGLVRWLIEKSS